MNKVQLQERPEKRWTDVVREDDAEGGKGRPAVVTAEYNKAKGKAQFRHVKNVTSNHHSTVDNERLKLSSFK